MRQNPRLAHHRRSSQSGPPTTIYNRFVRWARRGIWENLFRELAGNGRSVNTQMIELYARQSTSFGFGRKRGEQKQAVGRTDLSAVRSTGPRTVCGPRAEHPA